jgi:hypothetical protein
MRPLAVPICVKLSAKSPNNKTHYSLKLLLSDLHQDVSDLHQDVSVAHHTLRAWEDDHPLDLALVPGFLWNKYPG